MKPWIYFANRYYVRKLSTDAQYYELVSQGHYTAVALDLDVANNQLYTIDAQARKILRMFINGTGVETVVWHGVARPEGIAVDWIGRWVTSTLDAEGAHAHPFSRQIL